MNDDFFLKNLDYAESKWPGTLGMPDAFEWPNTCENPSNTELPGIPQNLGHVDFFAYGVLKKPEVSKMPGSQEDVMGRDKIWTSHSTKDPSSSFQTYIDATSLEC